MTGLGRFAAILSCFVWVVGIAGLHGCGPVDSESLTESGPTASVIATEEGEACWFGPSSLVCPPQGRGLSADDCVSARLMSDAYFRPDTGLCLPSMHDLDAVFPAQECAPGWLALPGRKECVRMGAACPPAAERFPTEDHLDRLIREPRAPVLYIDPDAAEAGDGSRAQPFRFASEALEHEEGSLVLVLSRGMHPVRSRIDRDIRIIGTCTEETVLRGQGVDPSNAAVHIVGDVRVRLEGLTVTGAAMGIEVVAGASAMVELEAVHIHRTVRAGIALRGLSDLHAHLVRIDETRPLPTGGSGRGLQLNGGAYASISASSISRNRDVAVGANDPGTMLVLHDVLIHDNDARGIQVENRAFVEVGSTVLARNADTGIGVSNLSRLAARDLWVADTAPLSRVGLTGFGVAVYGGSTFEADRLVVRGNHAAGVAVEGATLRAWDVLIEDTGAALDDRGGFGLLVQTGGSASVRRAIIRHSHDFGVLVLERGSELEMSHTVVSRTQPRRSAQAVRGETNTGSAIGVFEGAAILSRVHARESALAGLAVGQRATTTVSSGLISHNLVGVIAQSDVFEVHEDLRGTLLVENATPTALRDLPMPEPLDLLAGLR